ncbi:ATP-binding protein [Streptomyces sp. NPDC059881]|uniref:ATP-binding protein n=1 Tax=Streptomyces sp. NPDC059881 TaxID=3346986 RepID=UPI003651D5CF
MSAALPAQGQTRRLVLSGTRGVVGRCRDFSATALADWDWLPPDGAGHALYGGTHGAAENDAAENGTARVEFAPDEYGGWDERSWNESAWNETLDAPVTWDDERRAIAEDVLMVVSELVTNACLHAGGPLELVLHCTPDRLRIEVTDASPVPPRPRPHADPAVPGGHGLVVLARLARAWGSVPHGSGKTVWAEVAAPRRP